MQAVISAENQCLPQQQDNAVPKLILLAFVFALAVSFACGYGLRDWMSRRRRKEVRKRFYERYQQPQINAQETRNEIMTRPTRAETSIRELDVRLSKLEIRITEIETRLELDPPHEESHMRASAPESQS